MPNQKSLTEFLTFLKNITRKSISKLDRVTNFRLLRSTETSLLIGWNLPMSLENNRHAFHKLYLVSELHGRFDDPDAIKPHADTGCSSSYVFCGTIWLGTNQCELVRLRRTQELWSRVERDFYWNTFCVLEPVKYERFYQVKFSWITIPSMKIIFDGILR